MPNDVSSQPSLPDELQARLAAAGVSDDASLAAALQADPSLAADLQAFIEANAAAMAGIAMAALLAAFAAVEDSQQMMDFWRSVPAGLEEPLMEAVAALIADAEQAGDADTVAHLRPRLDGFRQIHEAARQADEQPPVVQAVIAFVQAEDDGAAEALFAQTRTLLQPYEAQRLLDEQATSDDPAMLQRITERRALLRRLRGAAPTPPPPTPSPPQTQVTGDLYQAGRDQYHFSAHAESGGTASVVNNLFIHNLERRWLKPAPPVLERDAVPRTAEMQAVLDALAQRESVAITGQVAKAQALAVQGAPGVGKTTLAHLLARQLAAEERYADGVIWQELGPDFTRPEQAQAVLRQWAGYATGFFGLPDNLNKLFVFEPEGVRSLLAEHPRLLVVLDNVWSLAAIAPLRAALPAGAHLLITTRQRDLAQKLGGGLVAVGLLSRAEALALCELRLGWRPAVAAADDGWVSEAAGDGWAVELAQGVGLHALGLDVALGVLHRYGDGPADWAPAARRLIAAVRGGQVERLHLGDDDPGHNVQAVIRFSYDALPDDEARRRLRTLAAFAPEAEFSTALAAAAWGCAEESAFETLTDLANAALLDRLGGGVWRQHGLLRAFGLALLRAAGEQEQAAAAHARAYGDAMAAADDEQRYHQMLPAMPQLRHAFDWALANDLELALSIAADCANVQKQFGLTREAGEWSERLLAVAQAGRAGPATLARAFVYRANILRELATLPGEARRQRLDEALAAYDEALRFRRPDTAPLDYAMTQNNRAILLRELATLPGEARRQRLYEALRCSVEAATLFEQFQQAQYLEVGRRVARSIRAACGDDFAAMWAELDLGEPPDWLSQDPEEMFQAIMAAHEPIGVLLQEYLALLQAADAEQPRVAPWSAVVALGERLLAGQAEAEMLLDWEALREQVARNYNTLGKAHDAAGDPAAALAAFERAVALRPDFAMGRRNQASVLIDLGLLDEAAAAIAQARALEPDAPRLAQLQADLDQARGNAGNAGG